MAHKPKSVKGSTNPSLSELIPLLVSLRALHPPATPLAAEVFPRQGGVGWTSTSPALDMATMFPERRKKEKYEGLQMHGEGEGGLIPAELGSRAPRPAVQPGESL